MIYFMPYFFCPKQSLDKIISGIGEALNKYLLNDSLCQRMYLIFHSEDLKDYVVLFKRIIATFPPASTHPSMPERFNTLELIAVGVLKVVIH